MFQAQKKQNKNILNAINDNEKMKAKVMEQTKFCNESKNETEKKSTWENKSDEGENKLKP